MAEVTAATPIQETAPAESATFDTKLDAKLAKMYGEPSPSEPAAPKEAEQATPEVADGELSADDLQTETDPAPAGDDYLELDRHGEKRKVSKEEAKRLAQQGWDYGQNQEALKADRAHVESMKQAIAVKAQLTPQVIDAAATVKMYGQALQQYQGVNWMQESQTDPIGYTQKRAQFDMLKEAYANARYQFDQVDNANQKVDQHISQQELSAQLNAVLEAAPELRDPKRYASEAGRIKQDLIARGVSEAVIGSLSDATYFGIARDAMRYRQAVQAKAQRTTQGEPSLRPGPAAPRANAETRKAELATTLRRAKTPETKKAAFDALLSAKLEKFAR